MRKFLNLIDFNMIRPHKCIDNAYKNIVCLLLLAILILFGAQMQASAITSKPFDDGFRKDQFSQKYFLKIDNGRITLIAKDSPLGPIMEEIGRRTGARIVLSPALSLKEVSLEWKNIPLEDGIKKLAGNSGLVFKKGENGAIILSEVHVLPSSLENQDNNDKTTTFSRDIKDSDNLAETGSIQGRPKDASPEKVLSKTEGKNPSIVMNEMVIRFNQGMSEAEIKKFLIDQNISIKKYIAALHYHVLSLPDGMTYYDALALLKSKKMLYEVEPNYIIPVKAIPNDPYFAMQWGLNNSGGSGVADADIDAPEAWNFSAGSSEVVIAVIDTGVDYTHEDLAANVWNNPHEIPGNNIDDDGNGFIDDVIGWDFVNKTSGNPDEDYIDPDNDPSDRHGHGTHVAGIIAAVANNSKGIAGLAYNCKIMPVRAGYMDQSGEGIIESADAAQGILYAAENGAKVINISWGDYVESTLIKEAISIATSEGAVICSSAGNDNTKNLMYPAASNNPAIIAVGATDNNDNRAVFSNYGGWVHVSAPGKDIYSTKPGNTYGYMSGTSMATPYVSALAAIIFSTFPEINPLEVKARIMNSVDVLNSLESKNMTSGRINAYSALIPDTISPCVFSASPERVQEGDAITISGYGFGENQANGFVRIEGYPSLNIIAWDNTRIVCQAPWGEIGGELTVTTRYGTSKSTPVSIVINKYDETVSVNSFINSGTRQYYQGDDMTWSYTLPFAFPFFGTEYNKLFISSNGFIDFTDSSASYLKSEEILAGRIMIAPLWDDLIIDPTQNPEHDIYIHMPSADSVCFRWKAKSYSTGNDVNVELILYKDGRIQFNYGDGNSVSSPVIGVSAGDDKNYVLSTFNRTSLLSDADTVIFTPCDRKFILFLKKGWNLISVPVHPADTVVPMVLGDAYNSIETIWGYFYNSWQIHIAGMFPESDFLSIKDNYGYWLKSGDDAVRVRVTGELNQGAINLKKGWNLTGYNSLEIKPVSEAISTIAGKVDSIWTYKNGRWYVYDPLHPGFSDLVFMEPGLGYWIKIRESCTWAH
jgi:subtilisin family serine protease